MLLFRSGITLVCNSKNFYSLQPTIISGIHCARVFIDLKKIFFLVGITFLQILIPFLSIIFSLPSIIFNLHLKPFEVSISYCDEIAVCILDVCLPYGQTFSDICKIFSTSFRNVCTIWNSNFIFESHTFIWTTALVWERRPSMLP